MTVIINANQTEHPANTGIRRLRGVVFIVVTAMRSYVLLLCRVPFGIIKLFHGHFVYLRFQLFEIV